MAACICRVREMRALLLLPSVVQMRDTDAAMPLLFIVGEQQFTSESIGMNKLLAGGVVLFFFAHAAPVAAQPDSRKALESLSERGQSEMAPGWRHVGITHKSAVFMHQDIRKTDRGTLAVWTHNELPVAEYLEKEKKYVSTRERMLVDCKASRLGVSDQAYYAQHFARGEVVGTNRISNVEWQEAVPDSIEELLVKTVCAPKPRKAAAKSKPAEKAGG